MIFLRRFKLTKETTLKGRIIKGVGGLYTVDTVSGSYACKAKGIFRKEKISPLIGDFVEIEIISEQEKEGVIATITPRKNELRRPKVCNIDQALLVFTLTQPAINYDLLDRMIILVEEQGLDIVICINKIDIASKDELDTLIKDYTKIGYKSITTSAADNIGIEELLHSLQNKVSVFCGPSGVGKSSLLNRLAPWINMETGNLSKKNNRGKHTTRHTQLVKLCENSYIMDSPGFSSLFFDDINAEDLAQYFKEFRPFIDICRFNNCSHIKEPGCEIKAQVKLGHINENRYDRYINLYSEIKP